MSTATPPTTSNPLIELSSRLAGRKAQADDTVTVPHQAEDSARKLIIGRGIVLSGEISDCEHLVVEGHARATITDCRALDVDTDGSLTGKVRVEEASIAGVFDGDLTVTGRLVIRGTGAVSGTVRYGELAVEAGGRMLGATEPFAPEPAPVCQVIPHPAAGQPRDRRDD